LVVDLVFGRIEEVGTVTRVSKADFLTGSASKSRRAIRDRSGS
jgi:hypothetical protein